MVPLGAHFATDLYWIPGLKRACVRRQLHVCVSWVQVHSILIRKKDGRSHTAVCVKKRGRAVVPAVVVSPRTATQSLRAYRFTLSHTRYPLIVPTIVMRNRLCTVHPSLQ